MKKIIKGQSLFEVVIALGIATLVMVAVVSIAAASIRNATFSRNKTQAASYAQAATEWLRGQRDADFATFSGRVGIWCLPNFTWTLTGHCNGTTIQNTPFEREVTISSSTVLVNGVNKTLITADTVVSWTDSLGSHVVKSSTNFTDWRQR